MNLDELSCTWFTWFRNPKARVEPLDLACWVNPRELSKLEVKREIELIKKALKKRKK